MNLSNDALLTMLMSIITGAKLRSMQHFHETNIFNTELEKHGMQPCQDKALLTNIENFHVNHIKLL